MLLKHAATRMTKRMPAHIVTTDPRATPWDHTHTHIVGECSATEMETADQKNQLRSAATSAPSRVIYKPVPDLLDDQ